MRATLLAPTDTGVQSTLKKLGYTVAEVTSNPLLVTELLTYHILPSQIQVRSQESDGSPSCGQLYMEPHGERGSATDCGSTPCQQPSDLERAAGM